MEYVVYKRFKGHGIGGDFNLRYGTVCEARDGFLFAPDGRRVCAVTSENGWEHFRPNTEEGRRRIEMLQGLYVYYTSGRGDAGTDLDPERFPEAQNTYWKSLLRTMPTDKLEAFYRERLGESNGQGG